MPRQLKVYGWGSTRGGRQTREVVAAHTIAEVLRISGIARSTWAWSGGVTRNQKEVELAMSEPGTVFWTDRVGLFGSDAVWHKDSRKETAT